METSGNSQEEDRNPGNASVDHHNTNAPDRYNVPRVHDHQSETEKFHHGDERQNRSYAASHEGSNYDRDWKPRPPPTRSVSERYDRGDASALSYPERTGLVRRQKSEQSRKSEEYRRSRYSHEKYECEYDELPRRSRSNTDTMVRRNRDNLLQDAPPPRAVDYYVDYTCGNTNLSRDLSSPHAHARRGKTDMYIEEIPLTAILPRKESEVRARGGGGIYPVPLPPRHQPSGSEEGPRPQSTPDRVVTGATTSSDHKPDKIPEVESVAEFTSNITASFIRIIFEEGCSIPRRIMWFVMWVACCGYAISNMNAAFTQYFLYDTSSQLSFTQKTGGNLPLPAITICNMNKFRESWLSVDENVVLMKYEQERVWGKDLVTDEDNEKAKKITVDELEADGRHSIEDMFQEVAFSEENLKVGDWGKHFQNTSTELGVCFTFNWDNSKKVKRTGADYGASFMIHVNQSEYAKTTESAGIKVMLHDYREPPLMKEYGLAIPPGSEAYISTRTLRQKNLGAPYLNSNCTNKTLQSAEFYTIARCNLECQSQILFEECNCTQAHHPRLGSKSRVCSLYDHRMCTEGIMKKIHHGDFAARSEQCGCIDACSSTSYSTSLSRAEFPSLATAREWINRPGSPYTNITSLKNNYIRLHVYFETMAVETVEKVASYSMQNLLGDVGGNLGLFIGASVATLAEILDYVARVMYFAIVNKTWRGRRDQVAGK